MTEEEPINNDKESITVEKNSRGKNWKIRVQGDPIIDEKTLAHLDWVQNQLEARYGSA